MSAVHLVYLKDLKGQTCLPLEQIPNQGHPNGRDFPIVLQYSSQRMGPQIQDQAGVTEPSLTLPQVFTCPGSDVLV